jgi:hypothetical protein
MKKNLQISTICKKIKRVYHPDYWVGYFRPDEICVLLEAGARETSKNYTDWAPIAKAKGDCQPVWFYFIPSKKTKDMVDPEFFMDYYRRQLNKHP